MVARYRPEGPSSFPKGKSPGFRQGIVAFADSEQG